MDEEEARMALRGLLKDRGMKFSEASEVIGRSHAYIQQYLSRRIPAVLDWADAKKLLA